MKRVLTLAVISWLGCSLAQAKVIKAEYFFDTDPGIGNGTPIDFDPDDPGFAGFDIAIPMAEIAALGLGNHQLVVRYQDDTPDDTLTSLEDITVMTDPMTGAVTGVTLITEDDISAGADWSVAYARSFVLLSSTPLAPVGAVDYAEYIVRNDASTVLTPLGSGVEISDLGTLTDGTRNLAFNVPSAALTKGDIYSLAIRFRDSLGHWSTTETRRFMLAPVPEVDGTVVKGEYTLSTMDGSLIPGGLGSGEMLMLPDAVNGVRMLTAVLSPEDIAALDPGTYSITIRFQDSEGDWSIPYSRSFTIPDVADVMDTAQEIVRGEYFILADSENLVPPALGTGTAFTLPAPVNGEIDLNTIIPGSAFPIGAEGIYHVSVRFQDDADNWSFTYTRPTMVPEAAQTAALIARIRYNIYDPDDTLVEEGQIFGDDSLVPFPSEIEDIVETHNLMVDPDPYRLEMYLLDNEGQAQNEIEDTFTVVTHRDLWDAIYFTDPGDRANELISGPFADPNGDGIPNLLAFALGLDPLSDAACTLELVQLDGEPYLSPLSQIPTVMPPGVDLSLRGLDSLPFSANIWTYDTDIDVSPQLIDTDNFTLMSPIEDSRSDRLNVHAVLGNGTRMRHFFDLCGELTGSWPYIYPMTP